MLHSTNAIHALFLWAVLFAGSAVQKQWDKIEFFSSPFLSEESNWEREESPMVF
jgi:hypothetical protein